MIGIVAHVMRLIGGMTAAALVLAACSDPVEVSTTLPPVASTVPVPTTTQPVDIEGLHAAPVRHDATARPIYFVMTDRFANGSTLNDTGDTDPGAGPLAHGFLPTHTGFYQGGDLEGLTQRLDYIAGLGVGAIWITPPFANRVVQGDGTLEGSSAGYHGYWNVDWTRIDPHLGDADDMVAFIDAANQRDIEVYFDIVVNHTGDVITFVEDSFAYVGTGSQPFLSADGVEFDPAVVAGSQDFPTVSVDISFPYTPTFATDADANAKAPNWLNDPTAYHNRGNSTFQGESSQLGDFFGLDDLFTEDPRVVQGMIDLYSDVISTYPIAGFRIDTAKHVNDAFWAEFMPAIHAAATAAGRPDFFVFGEVFSQDPIFTSFYPTALGFSSTLDFGFDAAVRRFVIDQAGAQQLADFFDDDDWFTDADSNASMQVKFLGNHDEGRLGYFVGVGLLVSDDEQLLAAMRLAYDLMYTTRGVPLVYYGDEQGFTGSGGDQGARQSMFASGTPDYLDDDLIGTDRSHATDSFDDTHPLFRHVSALSDMRREHPTLERGAQLARLAVGGALAFSRIDRDVQIEYVVAANSGEAGAGSLWIPTATPGAEFTQIYPVGQAGSIASDESGLIKVDVPARSLIVLMADRPIDVPESQPNIEIVRPTADTAIPTFRYRIEAEVDTDRYAEVTFSARIDGGEPVLLGVDDAPPYRVYWNNAGYADGAEVQLFAVVSDMSHHPVETSVVFSLDERR